MKSKPQATLPGLATTTAAESEEAGTPNEVARFSLFFRESEAMRTTAWMAVENASRGVLPWGDVATVIDDWIALLTQIRNAALKRSK